MRRFGEAEASGFFGFELLSFKNEMDEMCPALWAGTSVQGHHEENFKSPPQKRHIESFFRKACEAVSWGALVAPLCGWL
jgi:hypothetical protein